MATLLNSRNEFLKSAATRILGAGVYITSGVANAFTIPANGTTALPGLLTLTAVPSRYVSPQYTWLRRFGDTGDFTVIAGETTPVLNVAGDAAFVASASTSGVVQYRVDVIESGTLGANPSTFTLTIPILRQGVNSVVGVLTNESQTVSADVDGVVTAGTIIQSTLVIYNGISDDSANWTASIQSSSGITASLINGKTISVSLPVDTANGYVDITAVRQGYPNITKRFSITKVNEGDAGANGNSPISYEVLVNAPVIARSTSNILSPTTVLVSAFSTTGATKTAYSGRFKIYEDSVLKYTSPADLTTYTYTPTTFNISLLKVELYLAGGTTTLLDTQEIPVVVAGSSGMTLSVSNGSHLIPADNSGAVATYTGSGTTIQVFEGSTALTYLTTLGTTAGAFTIGTPTLSVASSITVGGISGSGTTTATVAQHSSMNTSVDSVVISYPITYNRANGAQATQTVTQSITKAKAGTLGIRGSRQLYSTDVAYTSTYDFDGSGAVAAGGASYAAKATALIATVTVGSTPTTPINGDTVTFSNGSNYVYTITHNGTTWVPPGTIIDGSLLVTGSVTASKINSNGLSIRDSSGNVILSAGTALSTAYISGLGALATQNSVAYSSVTGTKPPTNADNTASNTAAAIANQGTLATRNGVAIGTHVTFPDGSLMNTTDFVNRLSKINDTNISTFMSSAAIGNAYIGNAAISSAKIQDAAITSAKIGDLQVNTLKIAGNAVTTTTAVTGGTGRFNGLPAYTATDLCTLSFQTTGAPLLVFFGINRLQASNLSNGTYITVRLLVDGVIVGSTQLVAVGTGYVETQNSSSFSGPVNVPPFHLTNISPGWHTAQLQLYATEAYGPYMGYDTAMHVGATIAVLETKR